MKSQSFLKLVNYNSRPGSGSGLGNFPVKVELSSDLQSMKAEELQEVEEEEQIDELPV